MHFNLSFCSKCSASSNKHLGAVHVHLHFSHLEKSLRIDLDKASCLSYDDPSNSKLKGSLYLMQKNVKFFSAMFEEIRVGTWTLGLLRPKAEEFHLLVKALFQLVECPHPFANVSILHLFSKHILHSFQITLSLK